MHYFKLQMKRLYSYVAKCTHVHMLVFILTVTNSNNHGGLIMLHAVAVLLEYLTDGSISKSFFFFCMSIACAPSGSTTASNQ